VNDYCYNKETKTLAQVMAYNVFEFKDKDEDLDDVECYVVIYDFIDKVVYFIEEDEYNQSFLPFTLEDIPMLQKWYGVDDMVFHEIKKILKEHMKIN